MGEMNQEIDVGEALRDGDIFLCVKTMNQLGSSKAALDEQTCTDIGIAISKFSAVFIPIEYAELLLTSVAKLTEAQMQEINPFLKSSKFITGVFQIIKDYYSTKICSSYNPSSYTSHYCYELSLYILLGLLEKSSWINYFMNAISSTDVLEVVRVISKIFQVDTLYITQVSL